MVTALNILAAPLGARTPLRRAAAARHIQHHATLWALRQGRGATRSAAERWSRSDSLYALTTVWQLKRTDAPAAQVQTAQQHRSGTQGEVTRRGAERSRAQAVATPCPPSPVARAHHAPARLPCGVLRPKEQRGAWQYPIAGAAAAAGAAQHAGVTEEPSKRNLLKDVARLGNGATSGHRRELKRCPRALPAPELPRHRGITEHKRRQMTGAGTDHTPAPSQALEQYTNYIVDHTP